MMILVVAMPSLKRIAGRWHADGSIPFQRKAVLLFALAVLIITPTATSILYWDYRRGVLEEVVDRQGLFATSLALATQTRIRDAVLDLELLGQHPALSGLAHTSRIDPAINGIPLGLEPEKRQLFSAFQRKYPLFSVTFLLLPNGDHYLSHPFSVQKALQKFNLADRPYFQEVTRTRRTVVSDSFFGADGELAVAIDVPILDGSGRIKAHLGGVFHLVDLSRLVSRARIGESSAAFIIDRQGQLIAHTDSTLVRTVMRGQFSRHPLLSHHAARTRDGSAVNTLVYEDPVDGQEYVGTAVTMDNGWSFVLARRTSEVGALADGPRIRMAAGVALTLLVISGIALLVANRVGRRWDQAETALRCAHDDMERQVRQRSADLIDTNARLETEIAERGKAEEELKGYQNHLETLVADRARDLLKSNEELEREIAERERSEAALRERESHLRMVLTNAPIILFATDREGRITLSEGDALRKRGRRPGQVVGLSVFEMYLDRPDIGTHIRRALAGEAFTAQVKIGDFVYETAYVPLRDEQGQTAGMIGVANDVTERTRAENALRKGETSLSRAQKIAHLGNWDWDLSENVMTWSDEVYNIIGHTPVSAKPSYDALLKAIHPEDREEVKARIAELLTGDSSLVMEHRIVQPGGGERVVDLRAEVTLDGQARPVSIIGTLHDITDRKGTEEDLKAFASKLEQSNRDLQDFAYMASHDLQEPLNTLHSMGERIWLRLDDLLADEDRRDFAQILGSASRMKLMIEKILALSRVTTHAQPFVEVDLNLVSGQVVDDLRVRIEEGRGRVELGPLPTIEGDPVQLRQLLQNLVANGLKFHRPRKPPVVKVTARILPELSAENGEAGASPEACEITVEDNGIGFDETHAERIFTPFQRLQEGREFQGSGVGLATCRRIVERHGGTIRASSRQGVGSKFIVTLPVQQVRSTPAE